MCVKDAAMCAKDAATIAKAAVMCAKDAATIAKDAARTRPCALKLRRCTRKVGYVRERRGHWAPDVFMLGAKLSMMCARRDHVRGAGDQVRQPAD